MTVRDLNARIDALQTLNDLQRKEIKDLKSKIRAAAAVAQQNTIGMTDEVMLASAYLTRNRIPKLEVSAADLGYAALDIWVERYRDRSPTRASSGQYLYPKSILDEALSVCRQGGGPFGDLDE